MGKETLSEPVIKAEKLEVPVEGKIYANEDFVLFVEMVEGQKKYFIAFIFSTGIEKSEVPEDVFMMYFLEYRHELKKQQNRKDRHGDKRSLEDVDKRSISSISPVEGAVINKLAVADVFKTVATCPAKRQRHFRMHFVEGLSYTKIAAIEGVTQCAIMQSVNLVKKRLKKF